MKAIFSSAYVLSVFALSIGLSQTAKADVAIPAEIASPEAAVAAAVEERRTGDSPLASAEPSASG